LLQDWKAFMASDELQRAPTTTGRTRAFYWPAAMIGLALASDAVEKLPAAATTRAAGLASDENNKLIAFD
jgi:hypothetical protein